MSHRISVLCLGCFDEGLVSKAAVLAKDLNGQVQVLVSRKENIKKAFVYGADTVGLLENYETAADDWVIASWLKEKVRMEWKPEVVLAPATIRLRGILPILAGLLGAGLTADCTDLKIEEERLLQIRPAFGNHLMACIRSTSPIQMATVRQGIFLPVKFEKAEKPAESWELPESSFIKQISCQTFEKSCPLNQAEIILAGGAGIGSRENFEYLEEAAKAIGAGLGASRLAVDAGYAPYACQIGQTGITVHPKLYIAVGISGAVQHLAGMSGAETVIAINQDPKAPIFDYADYGIVGDWKQAIEKIVEKISDRNGGIL